MSSWIIAIGLIALAGLVLYHFDDLLTFDSNCKRSKW